MQGSGRRSMLPVSVGWGQEGRLKLCRQTPVQWPLFQDSLGKLAPEGLNQSRFQ